MGDLFNRFQKKCCDCKIVKQHNEFHNRKKSKDGKQSKCIQCTNKGSKQYRKDNREALQAKRNYNCKKYKAQQQVRTAVKKKQLFKPECCEECNKPGPTVGHHDDYDFPLKVRWLCFSCHGQWHMENGEAANAR